MTGPGRKSGVQLIHPGTQHAPRLARALWAGGKLRGFWTGFAVHGDAPLAAALPGPLGNRVMRGFPAALLHTRPWIEIVAQLRLRLGGDAESVMHERNRRFQEAVPQQALREAGAVIGFDTSSWILARRAAGAGVPFILDRSAPPAAAAQALFTDLARRYPDWRDDFQPRAPAVAEAERIEHDSAAAIVVASSFVRRCLVELGVDAARIAVIPYGVDAESFRPGARTAAPGVRFLCAGAVNARKGIPLLLEAWRTVATPESRLTIAGALRADRRHLLEGIEGLALRGAVPHAEMPDLYSSSDVLVFPSYHDGFGLVILEAMAAGLPVIATSASAGPDLIADGEDGFVIDAGDRDALAARMQRLARDPGLVQRMGQAARDKARQHTWQRYGEAWLQLLAGKGCA
jgi:starch synthase